MQITLMDAKLRFKKPFTLSMTPRLKHTPLTKWTALYPRPLCRACSSMCFSHRTNLIDPTRGDFIGLQLLFQ